ncbi:MAG: hypothetical protein WCB27_17260 [Thermoguttaceae bacterium]
MSKQTRASHPIYSLLPLEVEGFDSLAELALDIPRRCLRFAHRRTTQPTCCRTMKALQFPWKTQDSCGSDEALAAAERKK